MIDTVPRPADTVDLAMLSDLASMVVTELELRAVSADLQERTRRVQTLTRELTAAEETRRLDLQHILQEELLQSLQAARMQLDAAQTIDGTDDRSNAALLERRLDHLAGSLEDAIGVTQTLLGRFAPRSRINRSPTRSTGWPGR